jgi:hypothetical protein
LKNHNFPSLNLAFQFQCSPASDGGNREASGQGATGTEGKEKTLNPPWIFMRFGHQLLHSEGKEKICPRKEWLSMRRV